jgi:hypothetical protein
MKAPENQELVLQALYSKIPELKVHHKIMLPGIYFKNLSDEEFIVLYTLPNLTVRVTPQTMKYIESRRIKLGLIKSI